MQNRKIVVALFIVFLVPMLFAGIMFHRGKPIGKTTNHGTLITPPISTKNLFKQLPTKWTILWFNPEQCHNRQCLDLLHQFIQIIKAMGKYQNDVQIAILSLPRNHDNSVLTKIVQANRKINARHISNEAYQNTLKQKVNTGMIYLMDPRGFIMMRYPQNVDPMNIYHDLSKLLKFI